MEPLGIDLRRMREKQSLTLRQVSDATRISLRHLQNLEEARYQELPGGMYNRAFLRSYCEYLGIDAKEMLLRYDDEMVPQNEKAIKSRTHLHPPVKESGSRALLAWAAMLGISIVGLFFSRDWLSTIFRPYFSRGPLVKVSEVAPQVKMPPPPAAPAAPGIPAPTAGVSSDAITEPVHDVSAAPLNPMAQEPSSDLPPPNTIRLQFEIIQKCWVSVISDGNPVLVRLLEPGDEQLFDASERFYVILGNAGGVRLKINGKAARPLGLRGEVVKVLINKQNIQDFVEKSAG